MKRILAAGLVVLALAAGPAGARVFWGLGRTTAGLIPETDASYRRAYTAELTINQGHGQIEVWGTARAPEDVLRDLQAKVKQQGGHLAAAEGGPIAWAMAVTADGHVHRLLITAGEGRYSHVFQLSQDLADFQRSLLPPARVPLDVPEVPGGQVTSYLAHDGSGTALASVRTASDPLSLRAPYAAQLSSAGWQRMPAGGGDGAAFVREGALLWVTVKRTGAGDESLVTLAHKRLKAADRL